MFFSIDYHNSRYHLLKQLCYKIFLFQKHSLYPRYLSVDICGHFPRLRNLLFLRYLLQYCLLKTLVSSRYLVIGIWKTFVFSNLVQSSNLQIRWTFPAGCLLLGLLQKIKITFRDLTSYTRFARLSYLVSFLFYSVQVN